MKKCSKDCPISQIRHAQDTCKWKAHVSLLKLNLQLVLTVFLNFQKILILAVLTMFVLSCSLVVQNFFEAGFSHHVNYLRFYHCCWVISCLTKQLILLFLINKIFLFLFFFKSWICKICGIIIINSNNIFRIKNNVVILF